MSVDETPGAVDVDGVPGVLVLSWLELLARSVVGALCVATDDLGVKAGIAENRHGFWLAVDVC